MTTTTQLIIYKLLWNGGSYEEGKGKEPRDGGGLETSGERDDQGEYYAEGVVHWEW